MKRRGVRILVAAAVLLGLLILLGSFVLSPVVRPVVEKAAEAKGVDVDIGSLSVSLLGGRVSLGDVTVPNLPGHTQQDLATVASCVVNAAFLPLLRGDVTVQAVTLKRPELSIERDPAGEINLVQLLDRLAEPNTGNAERGPADEPAAAPPPPFRVSTITVRDMTVHWLDRAVSDSGAELVLEDLDVMVGDLYAPMPPERQDTTLSLQGQVAGGATGRVRAEGQGNFLGEALDFTIHVTLEDVALTAFTAYAGDVPLQPSGGTVSGTVNATSINNQLNATADLAVTGLTLTANPDAAVAMRLPGHLLSAVGNVDKNHEVQLTVSGDVRDPQFHVVSAVLLALVNDIANVPAGAVDAAGALAGKAGDVGGEAARTTGEAARKVGDAVGSLADRLPFGRKAGSAP